jgi:hypothetical protein
MDNISGSVGRNGQNKPDDVIIVQKLLNPHAARLGIPLLIVDGLATDNTIEAIRRYQKLVLLAPSPDGRIDVGGPTWRALAAGRSVEPPAPAGDPALSGKAWWHTHQANYPNSNRLSDLVPPFREQAQRFANALLAAGATVSVTSTLRHPSRAYLMHFCWRIAKGLVAPGQVPPRSGVPIRWDHGDLARSRAAAREMVEAFGMAHVASLDSIHIQGRAVDMSIKWAGTLRLADAAGRSHELGAPRNGASNGQLHAIGASYGVKKLVGDDPHWSATGH